MNTLIELKEEIRRSLLEDYNGPDEHENAIAQGVCARLLYLIDIEPNKKLEEEIADYISYLCEADIKEKPFEQIAMCARHFANWQKEQDESRKQANVKLANTDCEKDENLEVAFTDMWIDIEESLDSIKLLSPEQRATLKQAAHDWFEAGKIWEETNTTLNEQYNPDEYEVFMEGDATGIRRKNDAFSEERKRYWDENLAHLGNIDYITYDKIVRHFYNFGARK